MNDSHLPVNPNEGMQNIFRVYQIKIALDRSSNDHKSHLSQLCLQSCVAESFVDKNG